MWPSYILRKFVASLRRFDATVWDKPWTSDVKLVLSKFGISACHREWAEEPVVDPCGPRKVECNICIWLCENRFCKSLVLFVRAVSFWAKQSTIPEAGGHTGTVSGAEVSRNLEFSGKSVLREKSSELSTTLSWPSWLICNDFFAYSSTHARKMAVKLLRTFVSSDRWCSSV